MVRLRESHYQKYDYACSMPITFLQVSILWDVTTINYRITLLEINYHIAGATMTIHSYI